MFKSRRTGSRRNRDYRQLLERAGDKHSKMEGNSNITSNRITIPPGFLCLGIRSKTTRRTPHKKNLGSGKGYILEEDFQGLCEDGFGENCKKLRRSSRISRKSEGTQTEDSLTTDSGSSKGFGAGNIERRGCGERFCKERAIGRNNSGSIFREINKRCARARAKKSAPFNYPVSAVISPGGPVERFRPSRFCLSLFRELCIDPDQTHDLSRGRAAISVKIREVNDRLLGKMSSENPSPQESRKLKREYGAASDFQYVPRREWIYQTPPRQRTAPPKVEECPMQPAVLCTAARHSEIFELHPGFQLDLTGFASRQNVPVDRRYMLHLANFKEEESDFGIAGTSDGRTTCYRKRKCEQEPADYFSQVTCRPRKTVRKASRTAAFYDGRSGEDPDGTPRSARLFQTSEECDRDITFVEDAGVCKIISTQRPSNTGNRLGFKFRKNLFDSGNQKRFDLRPEEPKMFDFTQLQNN